MYRVVLDTNVIVSATISKGKPRELLDLGIKNRFSLVISEFILKETETVLRRPKFKTGEDEIQRVVLVVMQSGDMVRVESDFRAIVSDPSDNMILNTAYDGHADFVVTGDKALLRLKRFKKIRILSVSEALKLI